MSEISTPLQSVLEGERLAALVIEGGGTQCIAGAAATDILTRDERVKGYRSFYGVSGGAPIAAAAALGQVPDTVDIYSKLDMLDIVSTSPRRLGRSILSLISPVAEGETADAGAIFDLNLLSHILDRRGFRLEGITGSTPRVVIACSNMTTMTAEPTVFNNYATDLVGRTRRKTLMRPMVGSMAFPYCAVNAREDERVISDGGIFTHATQLAIEDIQQGAVENIQDIIVVTSTPTGINEGWINSRIMSYCVERLAQASGAPKELIEERLKDIRSQRRAFHDELKRNMTTTPEGYEISTIDGINIQIVRPDPIQGLDSSITAHDPDVLELYRIAGENAAYKALGETDKIRDVSYEHLLKRIGRETVRTVIDLGQTTVGAARGAWHTAATIRKVLREPDGHTETRTASSYNHW